MRPALIPAVLLLASTVFAASPDKFACAVSSISTSANSSKEKATVYLVQSEGWPMAKAPLSIDGTIVGSFRRKSYSIIKVDVGEHILCSSWRIWRSKAYSGTLPFKAEPGNVYFLSQMLDPVSMGHDRVRLLFLDEAQARAELKTLKEFPPL